MALKHGLGTRTAVSSGMDWHVIPPQAPEPDEGGVSKLWRVEVHAASAVDCRSGPHDSGPLGGLLLWTPWTWPWQMLCHSSGPAGVDSPPQSCHQSWQGTCGAAKWESWTETPHSIDQQGRVGLGPRSALWGHKHRVHPGTGNSEMSLGTRKGIDGG